jgi:hypothetical protein
MEKENKILIFRTSITKRCDIKRIGKLLAEFPQIDKWNVDFEDWEKILRIECSGITALEISEILRNNHICQRTGIKRRERSLKLPTIVSIHPFLQKPPSELHVSNGKYAYLPVSDQSDTPLLLSVHNEAAPPQDIH